MKLLSKIIGIITAGLFLALPALAIDTGDGITNPLGENVNIQDFIINIIQFLLGLSAVLAFAALIYGGIRLVASFGSEQSVKTGKSIILWAIVGIIVIMLSSAILFAVARLLSIG